MQDQLVVPLDTPMVAFTKQLIRQMHGRKMKSHLMDGVQCDSASTNFLSCSSNGWGVEDCSHSENVLLTCFATGKQSLTFSGSFGCHVAFTVLGLWTNSRIT